MAQLSRPTSAIVGLWLSSVIVGFGCQVIAGIEDRTSVAGSGGASSSSSGEMASSSSSSSGSSSSSSGMTSSSSGSSSSGVGLLMCTGNGAQPNSDCFGFACNMAPDLTNTECACGSCPHDCGGAGCANSLCNVQSMGTVSYFAYAVTTNGDAVFWASIDAMANKSYIYRLEFNDVDPMSPKIIGETDGLVRLIVADCDYVYMAVTGISKETIRKVPVNAVPSEIAVDIVANMTAVGVNAMEVDQEYVYFSVSDSGTNEVRAWHKGDEVKTVSTTLDRVTGLQRRDNYLYWADFGTAQAPGQIRRAAIPKLGLAWNVETIRKNAGRPFGFTVDDSTMYWIDLDSMDPLGNNVRKAPLLAPGSPELPDKPATKVKVQSAPPFPANWLVGDANYLYFIDVDQGVGSISRSKKQALPDAATTIASYINSPVAFNAYSLTTDARHIYITAPADPATGSKVLWVSK